METIIYQGQEVRATLVNYISCHIPTSTVDVTGDEELFRDGKGRYYLRRQLDTIDVDGENDRDASGRVHCHRISIIAAILWATTRINSETLDLRQAAAALLAEPNRYGVSPATLEAAGRYAATAGRTLEEMVAEFLELTAEQAPEDGPGPLLAASQPVVPQAGTSVVLDAHVDGLLRAYLAANPEDDPRDVVNGYLACLLECELFDSDKDAGQTLAEARRRRVAGEKKSGKKPAPGRVVVELDDLASAMLRRACQEGNDCHEAGEDPRDLVNAAVTFYLCGDDNSRCGKFSLEDGGEALERAKADRLVKETEAR